METTDDGSGEDDGSDDGEGDGEGESEGGSVSFDEVLGASGGSLAEWDGRDDATVQSVVQDAGFWLGSGDDERVFVEIEDETGLDELGLQDGDTVSFTGVVERNIEAETYGLRGGDAELFKRQGAHVRVQAADIEKS